jgi:hypothetical protein
MAQLSKIISKDVSSRISSKSISKGVFGAIALSLTFGAVASGRDLGQQGAAGQVNQQGAAGQVNVADASIASINRAAKTDRGARVAGPAIQTQTVSLRLNDLANTSVLIRLPLVPDSRSRTPAPRPLKSGNATVACEPSVSVLTEIAKRLEPGRCVT